MLWLSRARASALGSPSLWGTPHTGRWSAASRPLPTRCQRDDQECPQVLPSVPGETADGPAGRTPLTRPSPGPRPPPGPPGGAPHPPCATSVQCSREPDPADWTPASHTLSLSRRTDAPVNPGGRPVHTEWALGPVHLSVRMSHTWAGLAGVPHGFLVAPDRHWPTSHVQCLPLRRSRCAACTQTSARRERGRAAGNGPAGAAGGAGPQASVPSQLCLLAP